MSEPTLIEIVAEINDWHRYATDPSVDRDARATATLNLGGVMLDHWPAIRAALKHQAEVVKALEEIDKVIAAGDKWPPSHGLAAQLSLAEARAIRALMPAAPTMSGPTRPRAIRSSRPSPMSEPTPDLAAIVDRIEVAVSRGLTKQEVESSFNLSAIRAALKQRAELEDRVSADKIRLDYERRRVAGLERALREYGQHKMTCRHYQPRPLSADLDDYDDTCNCGWDDRQEAMLARSAAKEGSERG